MAIMYLSLSQRTDTQLSSYFFDKNTVFDLISAHSLISSHCAPYGLFALYELAHEIIVLII